MLGCCRYEDSSKPFIYSLSNNSGSGYAVYNSVKLNVKSDGQSKAVYKCHSHGPTFGFGYDIRIWDKTLQVIGILWLIVTEAISFPRVFFIWFSLYILCWNYTFTPTGIEVFYEKTTFKWQFSTFNKYIPFYQLSVYVVTWVHTIMALGCDKQPELYSFCKKDVFWNSMEEGKGEHGGRGGGRISTLPTQPFFTSLDTIPSSLGT